MKLTLKDITVDLYELSDKNYVDLHEDFFRSEAFDLDQIIIELVTRIASLEKKIEGLEKE